MNTFNKIFVVKKDQKIGLMYLTPEYYICISDCHLLLYNSQHGLTLFQKFGKKQTKKSVPLRKKVIMTQYRDSTITYIWQCDSLWTHYTLLFYWTSPCNSYISSNVPICSF